ncbi:MAG: alpha/beta fold hydrolase [Bacteriovorax sp.]
MKTLSINDIKLTYSEVNSSCPKVIVFLHGNSHSRKCFYKQLKDQRLINYRLISVDLPGHGDSSPLEDYSLINFSKIIKIFIEELNLTNFILAGHSLGGHVAIHLLNDINPNGILIFGTPPLTIPLSAEGFLDNKNARPLSMETANLEELEMLSDELRYSELDKEIFLEDYFKVDKNFRTGIFQSVANGKYLDEIELLGKLPGKAMVLISTEDEIVSNNFIDRVFRNRNSKVISFNGGHSPQIELPDQFNEILSDFAEEIFGLDDFRINNEKISDDINSIQL